MYVCTHVCLMYVCVCMVHVCGMYCICTVHVCMYVHTKGLSLHIVYVWCMVCMLCMYGECICAHKRPISPQKRPVSPRKSPILKLSGRQTALCVGPVHVDVT